MKQQLIPKERYQTSTESGSPEVKTMSRKSTVSVYMTDEPLKAGTPVLQFPEPTQPQLNNDDCFTFRCDFSSRKFFQLELLNEDFDKIRLLNPQMNGIYTIAIHASEKTAPKRYISEKIRSDTHIVRSNFDKLHIQLNRSYLMTIQVIAEKGKGVLLITVDDYVSNGRLANFKKTV